MANLSSGDVAPNFSLADQNDNRVKLDAYKGKKLGAQRKCTVRAMKG